VCVCGCVCGSQIDSYDTILDSDAIYIMRVCVCVCGSQICSDDTTYMYVVYACIVCVCVCVDPRLTELIKTIMDSGTICVYVCVL